MKSIKNMKKIKYIIVLLFIIIFLKIYSFIKNTIIQENSIVQLVNNQNVILLIYNPFYNKKFPYILKAYNSVLKEEGFNYLNISYDLFLSKYNKMKIENIAAIIFPDKINQYLPYDISLIIKDYLEKGGNIFISYDAGIKNTKDKYLKESIFTSILGINYITYNIYKDKSFLLDNVKLIDPNFIDFPLSRIDEKSEIINSYKYGSTFYYASNLEIKNKDYKLIAETHIYSLPFIILKKYKNGNIYYVNTPLGYLKAYSDDLILRTNLKAFLNKVVKPIHLSKLPKNKPILILNYHVDASIDWKSIEYMKRNNLLDKEIRASFHIIAGDFRDKEGDKLGFDALNKGRKYVEILREYGEIGSHGGWAHNYFSNYILNNLNNPNLYHFIKEYIEKNNKALEEIVGYKIVEYSAPNGVYPQPLNTKILEELNMICYYYTGDMGSCPNLTFYNGKKVSDKVLAYPVFPYKSLTSLGEMKKNNIPNQEVKNFLKYIIDYIISSENVILYYTHPYDIFYYPNEFKFFINYLKQKIKENKIQTLTMKEYTEFYFRFIKTVYNYSIKENKIYIEIYNPDSLKDISIIIPKKYTNNDFIKLNRKYLNKKDIQINENDNYYELIFLNSCKYSKLWIKLK